MSDKQTTMSNDTLEKIVCLRNSRMAVTVLKKIYVDEAKHVAHDIGARLSQVPTSASNLAQSREADTAACSLARTLNKSRMLPQAVRAPA
jgi:hypothetical protein